jgi:class 3 adenylate cyclase/tetratricopeptide (TPR) repeat protein
MNLAAWLAKAGLERLSPALLNAGIEMDVLWDLDNADLKEIGLKLGDRKRLLKALDAHRVQTRGPHGPDEGPHHDLRVRDITERRQLTVMFCDLVGATELSRNLDPEDLQRVVNAYHSTVVEAISPFDGHVAQFLFDGVLAYFGYPNAQEDAADRCLRASLAIIRAISQLKFVPDVVLRPRIGIATGRVVVGAIGVGTSAAEMSASGQAPTLAARLQAQAQPGQIILSEDTRRLVGSAFELETLEPMRLKGFDLPMRAWRLLDERPFVSRFEASHSKALTALVGRGSEMATLLELAAKASLGEAQGLLLSGEAGIGKSRICQTLREQLKEQDFTTVLWQCSPYFKGSALAPVARQLEADAGIQAKDSRESRLNSLVMKLRESEYPPESVGYLLQVVGLNDSTRLPTGQTAQQVKARTLEAIVDGLSRRATVQPVLLLLEDAHWIDPTTEELLSLAIEGLRNSRLFIVATARPDYLPPWSGSDHTHCLAVSRLNAGECMSMIRSVSGGMALPEKLITEIVEKADGVPLFVEELTKNVFESGMLSELMDESALKSDSNALTIPPTLQDSLMARLDRSERGMVVAQAGAAMGREFTHRLLEAVLAPMPKLQMLKAIDRLLKAELLFRTGEGSDATYTFKHALIRDTAYSSMVTSVRRSIHARIAAALQQIQADDIANQPEILAYHFQEASNVKVAYKHWCEAGDLAIGRTAIREGVTHYQAALALLGDAVEPPSDREAELELQMKLGAALMNCEGYRSPRTKKCFSRALELCAGSEDINRHLAACAGIGPSFFAAGAFTDVLDMFENIPADVLATADPANQIDRQACLGIARFHLGQFRHAWSHLHAAKNLDDANAHARGRLLGGAISCIPIRSYGTRVLAYSGYLDSGLALAQDALRIAESIVQPTAEVWALQALTIQLMLKGDYAEAAELANRCMRISESIGMNTRLGVAMLNLGQINIETGDKQLGLRQLQEGYSIWATSGGRFHCAEYCARAADGLLSIGLNKEAAQYLEMGEQVQSECEERLSESELLRLRGRLRELDGDSVSAEDAYKTAVSVAESQGAKLFSLRASIDLAGLLSRRGHRASARDVLQPVRSWFTQGFDYPDLLRADRILAGLA